MICNAVIAFLISIILIVIILWYYVKSYYSIINESKYNYIIIRDSPNSDEKTSENVGQLIVNSNQNLLRYHLYIADINEEISNVYIHEGHRKTNGPKIRKLNYIIQPNGHVIVNGIWTNADSRPLSSYILEKIYNHQTYIIVYTKSGQKIKFNILNSINKN